MLGLRDVAGGAAMRLRVSGPSRSPDITAAATLDDVRWQDLAIHRLVLDAGIDVPYSCEQGVCGACETRVIEGVPDHRDLVLGDGEKAANKTMMICCSRSKSDRLVLEI